MATPYYPWEEDDYGGPTSSMPASWELPYYAAYDIGDDSGQQDQYYPEYQQPQQLPPTSEMPPGYWGNQQEDEFTGPLHPLLTPADLMRQMQPQMQSQEVDINDPDALDKWFQAQSHPDIPYEKSFMERAVPFAARVAPALAGAAYGSTFGPVGTILGGAGGAMFGEGAGQWLGNEEFNPTQIGVQGLIGGATAPFGAARPLVGMGANAGLKAIAAYAGKEALLGGGIGALSTIPSELAASGQLPSWGQIGEGAAIGGVTGGLVGAGIGRFFPERIPAGIPNSRISGLADEIDRAMGNSPPPPHTGGGVVPPDQYGRINNLSDEIDRAINGGQPPPPTPPPAAGPVPTGGTPPIDMPNMGGAGAEVPVELPPVVIRKQWDQSMIQYYLDQGYIKANPGETAPNGFPFMKLPDANVLPNASGVLLDNPSPATVKTMQDQGYVVIGKDQGGSVTMVFKAEPQKAPLRAPNRPVPTPKEQYPRLPKDLSGARPTYQSYELVFDNDIDLAAYIIAGKAKSPRDADYRDFLLSNFRGATDDQIMKLGQRARTEIGRQVRGQPKGSVVELSRLINWTPNPPAAPRTGGDIGLIEKMFDQMASQNNGVITIGRDQLNRKFENDLLKVGYRLIDYNEKTNMNSYRKLVKDDIGAGYPGALLRAIMRYKEGGFNAVFMRGEHAQLPKGTLILAKGEGANEKFYFAHPEQSPDPVGPFWTQEEAVYSSRQYIKDVPTEPIVGGGVAQFKAREHNFDAPTVEAPRPGLRISLHEDTPGPAGEGFGPYEETPERAIKADTDEIRHAPSAGEARLLSNYWANEAKEAVAAQDLVRARHANDMSSLAKYRANELLNQERGRSGIVPGPGSLDPNSRLADIGNTGEGMAYEVHASNTAKRWATALDELDATGAPDEHYKSIMNIPDSRPLGPGETYRDRVVKGIGFFEEAAKKKGGGDFTPPGGTPRPPSGAGPSDMGGGPPIGGGGEPPRGGGGEPPPMGPMEGGGGYMEMMSGEEPPSFLKKLWGLTRGATTTWDLSAPLRQGLPLIYTKQYRKAFKTMIDAWGSEGAYERMMENLRQRELFKRDSDPITGKEIPSWAETRNLKLTDLDGPINAREEQLPNDMFETGRFFDLFTREPGTGRAQQAFERSGLQGAWQKTGGNFARKSNRAYTAFLNQLRADTFESLIADASRLFEAGAPGARNPLTDIEFGKEIADFVNTATGRGPLKMQVLGGMSETTMMGRDIRLPLREYNAEWLAPFLTNTLFSPRLFTSRMRMLNPATYIMADPFARKQYLKAAIATVGAWGTTAGLASTIPGLGVSWDPNSADFGKIRVGNTRIDPAGGFQQYVVAISRLLTGHTTSSATQRDFELGQGYRPDTRADIALRFGINKTHPVIKFAYDLLNASEKQPFTINDRVAQMFVPLIAQDLLELIQKDPKLIPFVMPPVALGMGTQTYEGGQTESRVIPQFMDPTFKGGNPLSSWQMGNPPKPTQPWWRK